MADALEGLDVQEVTAEDSCDSNEIEGEPEDVLMDTFAAEELGSGDVVDEYEEGVADAAEQSGDVADAEPSELPSEDVPDYSDDVVTTASEDDSEEADEAIGTESAAVSVNYTFEFCEEYVPGASDGDEFLLDGYIEQRFSEQLPDGDSAFLKPQRGNGLTGKEAAAYAQLGSRVRQVAAGELTLPSSASI